MSVTREGPLAGLYDNIAIIREGKVINTHRGFIMVQTLFSILVYSHKDSCNNRSTIGFIVPILEMKKEN